MDIDEPDTEQASKRQKLNQEEKREEESEEGALVEHTSQQSQTEEAPKEPL